MRELFRIFSHKASEAMGSPWAFIIAIAMIITWAFVGPTFKFSDTWQLVINTTTTIITFLMVFLIQNTQNRDTRVTNLKLDEIIRAHKGARDSIIELQALSDDDLDALETEFKKISTQDHNNSLNHSLKALETVLKAHKR